MNKSEQQEFIDMLGAAMEIYSTKLTPAAITIWAAALSRYPLNEAQNAIRVHLSSPGSGKFAPKPADLIGIIQSNDGRPSADEAWSMIPRNESVSAVLTQDMLTAMASAQPLLDEGDQVAARMAFKDTYNRLVDEGRRFGKPVDWQVSLGDDRFGREAGLAEAVRLKRLTLNHARSLLPIADFSKLTELPSPGKTTVSQEQAAANIIQIKTMLNKLHLTPEAA